jgi:ESF2/ABP1 family protein
MHTARLRLELSQSRSEQREYLKNVDLARVLDKREARSQAMGKEFRRKEINKRPADESGPSQGRFKKPRTVDDAVQLANVLGNIF